MDQKSIEKALYGLPLGKIQYFDTISSTNDLAVHWANEGVPDFSLIVADEQTQGRGRAGRSWHTPSTAALAFSLVLHPQPDAKNTDLPRWAGLGALAVCEALNQSLNLPAQIKWPNDVLLQGKKVSGVLAEAHWMAEQLQALILGIGINVAPSAVPPADTLDFPATSVQAAFGETINRLDLLKATLTQLLRWRQRIFSTDFLVTWEKNLAYKGDWVQIILSEEENFQGQVIGLGESGQLRLKLSSGQETMLYAGEIHLRPLVDRQPD